MYRKVLVPLDGSKEAEKVIPIVKKVVVPGHEVILLQVIADDTLDELFYFVHGRGRSSVDRAPGQSTQEASAGEQPEDAQPSRAMSYLQSVAKQQDGDSLRWRCEVVISKSVSQGILDFATREGVDLIAMYSHDRKGLAKLLKSSISRDVRLRAPVDVKVFKPQELTAPIPETVPAAEPNLEKLLLKETDVFRSLSEAQLDKVASLAQRSRVPTGQVLATADAMGEHLFVIISGDAQLSAPSAIGEVTVRIAGPGESFPLAALVGSGTLITSAKALTDMELLVIPRASLLDLCAAEPEIGMRIYSATAEVFADRYRKTLAHLSLSFQERVLQGADFLANV